MGSPDSTSFGQASHSMLANEVQRDQKESKERKEALDQEDQRETLACRRRRGTVVTLG